MQDAEVVSVVEDTYSLTLYPTHFNNTELPDMNYQARWAPQWQVCFEGNHCILIRLDQMPNLKNRIHIWYYKSSQKPMAREVIGPSTEATTVVYLAKWVCFNFLLKNCYCPYINVAVSPGQRSFFLWSQWLLNVQPHIGHFLSSSLRVIQKTPLENE